MLSIRHIRVPGGGGRMLPREKGRISRLIRLSCVPSTSYHSGAVEEYREVAEYPEVEEISLKANIKRRKEAWRKKVTELPTIEQKMMELNMPRYHGHWSCSLKDDKPMIYGVDFVQFATRTHLEEKIPQEYYSDVWQRAEQVAEQMAPQVEQLIKFNFKTQLTRNFRNPNTLSHQLTRNFLFGLHRLMFGALQDTPHIAQSSVDWMPRIESYWLLGSLPPDEMMKKTRRNTPRTKDLEHEPVERSIQGKSSPCLSVRTSAGLPKVIERDQGLSTEGKVPQESLDPRAYGFKFRHNHATTVNGRWPSEGAQYGQVFLHGFCREKIYKEKFGPLVLSSARIYKALVASFTQAHAHATYLGFGAVTELTYPLVQQSVFTDGQRWSLGLYQLNTCALHSDRPVNNPYNNILWLGNEERLFEDEGEAGGVKGLNIPLLTSLVAMYLKEGVTQPNPTPYLPLKYVANHPAKEKYREDFHKHYLWLSSNRPRHREKPEIYLWEKIYKVDFKTRSMDAPHRFFMPSFRQKDPGQRRLDDTHTYIPKALREDKKVKFRPRLNTEHLYKYD